MAAWNADYALPRLLQWQASDLRELLHAARVSRSWARAATGEELKGWVEVLAQRAFLPDRLPQARRPRKEQEDWWEFCSRQLRLQGLLAGAFLGTLTPENLPPSASAADFSWEEQLDVAAALEPADLSTRRASSLRCCVHAREAAAADWTPYQWLVLDRSRALDALLWDCFSLLCEEECPEERWEDGDLHCGVRGPFDFRPAVDPTFLDLRSLVVVLWLGRGIECKAWALRLFAPCAWMLPKAPKQLDRLDQHAQFQHEATVAALTLGRQLERPLRFEVLEELRTLVPRGDVKPEASRRRAGKKQRGLAEPKDHRSGRNPKGLNLFIPRRTSSDDLGAPAAGRPAADSLLACGSPAELPRFLEAHRPSRREAEQLVVDGPAAAPSSQVFDLPGFLEDAARLEAQGALSRSSVVELAKKWRCLSGKWLLFVPEWRIDELFSAAAERLHGAGLGGCTRIVVSPPGAFGTDPKRFMLSAHCGDFTNRHAVMLVGKLLRGCAREGLRTASGDSGELQDDPFAERGRKVKLVFKADAFTRLGLRRGNPYGIKTTLFEIDL